MYFYHDISLFLVLTVKSSLIRQMLLLHLQMVYWQGLAVFVVAVCTRKVQFSLVVEPQASWTGMSSLFIERL